MSTPVSSSGGTPLTNNVPQGAGNALGTAVLPPTRSAQTKDVGSSSLGTFGVCLNYLVYPAVLTCLLFMFEGQVWACSDAEGALIARAHHKRVLTVT